MGAIIKTKGLIKDYNFTADGVENGVIHVLRGLDFQVEENDFVCVMGKSGCGKTTLLKILGLIEKQTRGDVIFRDKHIDSMAENDLAVIRRQQIGFVFQDYYLMNSISVEENIVLPMLLDKAKAAESLKRARILEKIFGIRSLAKKKPYELSGGEKQRVAICRALINNPDIILADEPTGNLDFNASNILIKILENIHDNGKKTIVIVTHDPKVASHCNRVLFLKDGMLVKELERKKGVEEFYSQILKQTENTMF